MECLITKWQEKDGANTLTAKGLIRINDNKPEFGSLMLMTPNVVTINNGFMNTRDKVGFITGRLEDLKKTIKGKKLREGTDYSEVFGPHKIVTLEILESEFDEVKKNPDSEEPGDEGYREKINPSTGEILKKGKEVIFWKTEVVSEAGDVNDRLITHDRAGSSPQKDPATMEFTGKKGKKKDKKKKKADLDQ
jgi:hypothetical protein